MAYLGDLLNQPTTFENRTLHAFDFDIYLRDRTRVAPSAPAIQIARGSVAQSVVLGLS